MLFLTLDTADLTDEEFACEYELLDIQTRHRLENTASSKAKKQTLAGRILLRRALFQQYGVKDYSLYYNPNGKPLLDFCCFSIAHSNGVVACAVDSKPIGVDVEYIRNIKQAQRYPLFSAEETAVVNSAQNPSLKFLELWTKKEAYIKMHGIRMSDGCIEVEKIKDAEFKILEKNGFLCAIALLTANN